MSFSKIAQIALYIVVVISVLVVALFYFGDNLIDAPAYEAKIQKLNTAASSSDFTFVAPAETDTAAVESDTAQVGAVGEGSTEDSLAAATIESTPSGEVTELAEEAEEVNLSFMETLVYNKVDIAIVWAYILVIITLIATLLFSLTFMFSHTKSLVRGLLILIGAAILIGVAYMLGSDTPLQIIGFEGTANSDPQVLKIVDTGLISTYFILGLIVLAILYSEIAKYFK